MQPNRLSMKKNLSSGGTSAWLPILGHFLIGICIAASAALVLQHFLGLRLPGCGVDSYCAAAAASVWGSLAGWPISFIGLAYFVGIGFAWLSIQGAGVPAAYRYLVRLGALVSIAYIAIMVTGSYFCSYCLVIHVANLSFWLVVERSRASTGRSLSTMVTVAASMALVSSLLNAAVAEQERRIEERAERELQRSIEQALSYQSSLRHASRQTDAAAASSLSEPQAGISDATAVVSEGLPGSSRTSAPRIPFRMGSAQAAVQLVVFYDYECEFCRRVDADIQTLLNKYQEIMSITVRHYPLCVDCNFSLDFTTHPHACQAAQVAEAAGILKGDEGFWSMHRWLFQRRGTFTPVELEEALVDLGIDDHDEFRRIMNGKEVLSAILADVVEAQALQIRGTPTVFVNGSKLLGLRAENAVVRAVMAVVEQQRAKNTARGEDLLPQQQAIERALADGFPRQLQLTALAATVRIVNSARNTTGSGVVVAVRPPFVYALTANHLVKSSNGVEVQTFTQESYPEPARIYKSASVTARSEEADLAVLRFSSSDFVPPAISLATAAGGEDKTSFAALTVGCDGEAAPTCLANHVTGKLRIKRSGGAGATTVWQVQDPSTSGRSGGPLVNEDGVILGLASGVSEGKGYFCHIDEIYRLLNRNGLQWLAESDANVPASF